jgi:N-acetylglucosaminyldiphosphoundecaprenol N-acetyl-beta-D-mannosaminyltransferase
MNPSLRHHAKDKRLTNARISLGPVEIDAIPRDDLVDRIIHEAFHADGTRVVATINAQFYLLAERDAVFQDCLRRSEMTCADGFPIGVAAGLLAGQRVERVAGVEIVEEICRRGAGSGLRVFLLGGRPGSGALLAELLKGRYPGLEVAGVACPPFGFEKREQSLSAILGEVAATRPHVVFVALGAPKQEMFIDQYLRNLKIPVAIGVGGSFEIITGVTRRAPKLVQQVGMEWMYRLCQEPHRLWRRYLLGNPHFLWIMSKYFASGKEARQAKDRLYVQDSVRRGRNAAPPIPWK